MTIRVTSDGEMIVDTQDELMAVMRVRKKLAEEESSAKASSTKPAPSPKPTALHTEAKKEAEKPGAMAHERLDGLMKILNANQRMTIATISKHPEGLTMAELAGHLRKKVVSTISGYLTPAKKHIAEAGFELDELYRREEGKGRRKALYYPGSALANYTIPTDDYVFTEGEDANE